MRKLERFAVRKPVLFGVLMIVAWSVLSALTYPLHFLFPDNDVGLRYGDGVSKAAISVLIVLLLWRLGWLGRAGIARSVSRRDWLVISILGVYLVGTVLFAFTGSFAPVVASTPAAIAEFVVTLPGALTEELLFRGLILIAMLNAWAEAVWRRQEHCCIVTHVRRHPYAQRAGASSGHRNLPGARGVAARHALWCDPAEDAQSVACYPDSLADERGRQR